MRIKRPRSALILLAWLLIPASGCCARREIVHVGSPHDRYDHNRTRRIAVEGWNGESPIEVIEEAYTPSGADRFPLVMHVPPDQARDRLPAGRLVPVFTGVPLPLSDAPVPLPDGRSDRDDLIDFLSVGSDAQAGVAPGEATGDQAATERRFGGLLDQLSREPPLAGDGSAIRSWVAQVDVPWTDRVNDSRYRPRAFKNILAIRCDHFWFVLYQPPDQSAFTRLVVAAIPTTARDFSGKRPFGGKRGSCERSRP